MRFGSTAKVLAKCILKYYRISECVAATQDCLPAVGTGLCLAGPFLENEEVLPGESISAC